MKFAIFAKFSKEEFSSQQLKQKLQTCELELHSAVKSRDILQQELDTLRRDYKNDMSSVQTEVEG